MKKGLKILKRSKIPSLDNAPGLEVQQRADGSFRSMWRAPKADASDGFVPKSVTVPGDITNPADHDMIRSACHQHQAELAKWRLSKARAVPSEIVTYQDLSRLYQTHEASPFLTVKENSRRDYLYELRVIERTIGLRTLAGTKAVDFTRWFKAAKDSVEGGGARKAYGIIKRIRAMVSFGIVAEVAACHRLKSILEEMRFEQPPRREAAMTYEMAVAIIAQAHKENRPSIALAQAIQFETGLRQVDVIGQWLTTESEASSPYRIGKKRWKGLVWQHISADLILTMKTSKTGATAGHDLSAMPLVKAELDRIPKEKRIGPVVINENTGLPYVALTFSHNWREIADRAGVPKGIWNRDSRAGALTEGDEAGAEVTDLQRMAGHTTAKMTGRYIRGAAVVTSQKVARLRVQRRSTNDK